MLSSSRTSQRFARLLSTSNLLRLARARASLPTRPVVGPTPLVPARFPSHSGS